MTTVVGRDGGRDAGPACRLGSYRARDGSCGAPLHLDVDRPHAAVVVGKRGYGKSYTLGVLAEALARSPGVAPVVVDPMGAFGGLAEEGDGEPVPATVVERPAVAPEALDPRSWCVLLDLDPASGAGALVWQAAARAATVAAMREWVADADAPRADRRAARNHLRIAAEWDAVDADGLRAADLAGPEATVLDVSGYDDPAANAVVRVVATACYRARVEDRIRRLPWLLVDEAHAFFDGVAGPALETLLTRGRAPGASLVVATQRPSAVPAVAISQADLLVAHRLTAERDVEALAAAQPTYLDGTYAERLPESPGEVLLVDDVTETVHAARVRERDTPHGGDAPRATEVSEDGRAHRKRHG